MDVFPPQENISSKAKVDWGNVFLIVSVILFVLIAGLIFYARYINTPAGEKEAREAGDIISGQVQDPAEKLPQTNPFEAKTNPFENAYENPF